MSPDQNDVSAQLMKFKAVYIQLIAFQILMVVVALFIIEPTADNNSIGEVSRLFPLENSLTNFFYPAGVLVVVAALFVPRLISKFYDETLKDARSKGGIAFKTLTDIAFAPYMVKLVLFELLTILGFLIAFLNHSPVAILPLALIGITGVAVTKPNQATLLSLLGASDLSVK